MPDGVSREYDATNWEAYISGRPSDRDRNVAMWAEAARRMGFGSPQIGYENKEGLVADREVRVKLIADVDDYIAAMKRAAIATRQARSPKRASRLTFALIGAVVGWVTCAVARMGRSS